MSYTLFYKEFLGNKRIYINANAVFLDGEGRKFFI